MPIMWREGIEDKLRERYPLRETVEKADWSSVVSPMPGAVYARGRMGTVTNQPNLAGGVMGRPLDPTTQQVRNFVQPGLMPGLSEPRKPIGAEKQLARNMLNEPMKPVLETMAPRGQPVATQQARRLQAQQDAATQQADQQKIAAARQANMAGKTPYEYDWDTGEPTERISSTWILNNPDKQTITQHVQRADGTFVESAVPIHVAYAAQQQEKMRQETSDAQFASMDAQGKVPFKMVGGKIAKDAKGNPILNDAYKQLLADDLKKMQIKSEDDLKKKQLEWQHEAEVAARTGDKQAATVANANLFTLQMAELGMQSRINVENAKNPDATPISAASPYGKEIEKQKRAVSEANFYEPDIREAEDALNAATTKEEQDTIQIVLDKLHAKRDQMIARKKREEQNQKAKEPKQP